MAHERIDTNAEKIWHARKGCYGRWRVGTFSARQSDAGEGDHGPKGQPPHQRRQHLEVLGLCHVEEAEGADNGDEDGESNSGHEKIFDKSISEFLFR